MNPFRAFDWHAPRGLTAAVYVPGLLVMAFGPRWIPSSWDTAFICAVAMTMIGVLYLLDRYRLRRARRRSVGPADHLR